MAIEPDLFGFRGWSQEPDWYDRAYDSLAREFRGRASETVLVLVTPDHPLEGFAPGLYLAGWSLQPCRMVPPARPTPRPFFSMIEAGHA